jgi:hypothetical protein
MSFCIKILNHIIQRTIAGKRDDAILEFGFFFGGRRRDEIAKARYRFLEKAPCSAFRYYLHHSKTDQTGKRLELEVKAKNTKNLKNWIKAANIYDGSLFSVSFSYSDPRKEDETHYSQYLIERAYSRHYIWNQSQEKKLKVINEAMPEQEGAVDQGHSV